MINGCLSDEQKQPRGPEHSQCIIFLVCRAVTLVFPLVIDCRHHRSAEEGRSDCTDAELWQAAQKSRSVGHPCKPEQKGRGLDPASPGVPEPRLRLMEPFGWCRLDAGGWGGGGGRCDPWSRKPRGKTRVWCVDTGRVREGPGVILLELTAVDS